MTERRLAHQDLKSRGYRTPACTTRPEWAAPGCTCSPRRPAGLYRPAAEPTIGRWWLWKGAAKPLGLAAMALTALVGFFHYIRVGRNVVTEEEELAAAREAEEAGVDGAGRTIPPASDETLPGPSPENDRENRHD